MKISSELYRCALKHVVENGDTDLFPYPFEIAFLRDCEDKIILSLSNLELDNYSPMSLVESLIPKNKFGFRIAHQPFPIDTVIFTALVLRIFDEVENGRDPADKRRAFSYRKQIGNDHSIFLENRNYNDWLNFLSGYVLSNEYSHVVRTDISDFYHRIYRHRLENILGSLSREASVVRKIERFISDWRTGQSFGLPVGSSAARLLAEASLNDTDMALISENYEFSRYVDDFVIFVKNGQDPYAALAFLARHLSVNEGLSLNNQKTKILSFSDFIFSLGLNGAEDESSQEKSATEKLFWAAYQRDTINEDTLSKLMTKDLTKELEDLLLEPYWDLGSIKITLHAMRLVKSIEISTYIRKNINELVPFSKDVCLLIRDFFEAGISGFEDMSSEIVDLLLSPRMQSLDCARAWFLDLGVKGIVNFDNNQIRRLDALNGTLDVRQLHLLKWRSGDQNFFRSRKARVSEINSWAQPSFIFGAQCLPRDEYTHFVRGIKSRLQFPLAREFADWCLESSVAQRNNRSAGN